MSDFVPLEKINYHLAHTGIKMRSRLRPAAKPIVAQICAGARASRPHELQHGPIYRTGPYYEDDGTIRDHDAGARASRP